MSDTENLNLSMHGVVHGPTYDAGAAWKKTDETGKPYLVVKLDGPTFVAPIDCALVGPNNKGRYRLVWTRKNRNESANVQQTAA